MALINYTNEFGKLKRVALYKPLINEVHQGNPSDSMYITNPNAEKVLAEFENLVKTFSDLGLEVVLLEDSIHKHPPTTNMIFLRDVAAIIDEKIILANMKYDLRKAEPYKFKDLLMDKCKVSEDTFVELPASMTMEGADIILCGESKVIAYTGFRTSPEAIGVIANQFQISVKSIPANIQKVPQHLLGAIHVIGPGTIARRPRYCNTEIDGFEYIDFEETDEIKNNFAMNIVTIAPNEILMPSNCPETKRIFEENGIKCHIVEISEIHKMGGGLACMTLPLERLHNDAI
jgi:N-dimethylarginine dimethylaminohydrolase